MKKIKFKDLYFGVTLMDYKTGQLKEYNLFEFLRVRRSVARYITAPKALRKEIDKNGRGLFFCFGDVSGRCEFESLMAVWPPDDKLSDIKVDTFRLYVKPNADYLMALVNSVSKTSAKEYLKNG